MKDIKLQYTYENNLTSNVGMEEFYWSDYVLQKHTRFTFQQSINIINLNVFKYHTNDELKQTYYTFPHSFSHICAVIVKGIHSNPPAVQILCL